MTSGSQLGSIQDDAGTSQPKSHVKRPEGQGHGRHSGRRVFVGPMPEKVVSQLERRVKERELGQPAITLSQLEVTGFEDDDDEVAEIVRGHARQFLHNHKDRLRRSESHEDDWDEDTEHHLTEEMIQRWKDSEWGKTWHNRHRQRPKSDSAAPSMGVQASQAQWVGGSFEIGTFLGVNVLHGPSAISHKPPTTGSLRSHLPLVRLI